MDERIHWLAFDQHGDHTSAFDQHGDHTSACGTRSYDHAVANPMLVTCLRCRRSKAWRQPGEEQEKKA